MHFSEIIRFNILKMWTIIFCPDQWNHPLFFNVIDNNTKNNSNTYILLDGLSYNTRGYFASCLVFFRAPQGRGKIRAMSKMSASIIC